MSQLFQPITFRGVTLRNRVVVAPMCQYSAEDGLATHWHMVHLGSRAIGGAGLIIAEATAVSPEGRITPDDLGIWSDAHVEALRPVVQFMRAHGAVAGVQLAHAGRKGARFRPWDGNGPLTDGRAWSLPGPSAIAFDTDWQTPEELDSAGMQAITQDFVNATKRAVAAGFEVVELHMAHGYLLHTFLSPLSNKRKDAYGGDLPGRAKFPLELTRAVRAALPDDLPLFIRISAVDWVEGGLDIEQSVELCRWFKEAGADLIDCSTGAVVPGEKAPIGPGYQVSFASAIRSQSGIPTGAVGLITDPAQAEQIVALGEADVVLLARAMLRDPYWPNRAAEALGAEPSWPIQYKRAVAKRRSAW
ncbi:NADH:flavin oxidoreductase/NADH oxidase [Ferrovibrio sp.]|uniref:NADH:flavin oxidoreductase/NADH oxidase n=1 Tax=Ferrovibrio sp. TaxID=1917215 RepID=UPI0035B2D662